LFLEDGALALDRHDLWQETPITPRKRLLQAAPDTDWLKPGEGSVTVARMPSPRPYGPTRRARRRSAAARGAGRFAGLVVVATVIVVTLLLTAFGAGEPAKVSSAPPAPSARLLPDGPPRTQIVAVRGALRLQLPIAQGRVTAVGFHAVGDGALALHPLGRQANRGFLGRLADRVLGAGEGGLAWFQLEGGEGSSTAALDVGAAPGTDVFAPADGTVVGITPYVLDRRRYGARIDIRPSSAPSLVVSITRLRPDSGLSVGSAVTAAGSDRLGTVLDLSDVERQALAEHTQDAGNHVTLEVHPAGALVTS